MFGIPDWITDPITDITGKYTGYPTSTDRQNADTAQQTAADNYAMQKRRLMFDQDIFAWQKESQEQAWAREDSAVQRRKADLEAAGINPLMAAGSSATTMSPINPHGPSVTPQKEFVPDVQKRPQPDIGKILALLQQKAVIDQTSAQADLTRATKEKVNEETGRIKQEVQIINPQRVKEIVARTENLGVEKVNKLLDRKIKDEDLNIKMYYFDVLQQLEYETGLAKKTLAEKEVIAKAIAIETARHNLSYAKRVDVPTGQPSPVGKVSSEVGSAILELLEKMGVPTKRDRDINR